MTNGQSRTPGRIIPFYGEYQRDMLLADVHVHTRRSDGWWKPEALVHAALERGLSAIATTDHDDCRSGFTMADYCARRSLPLAIYPGSEISARERGHDIHVLGLNLTTEIRPWQTVAATVEDILKQGAIPVLPHPKPVGRGLPTFDQILALEHPVAVEVYNASLTDLRRLHPFRDDPDANLDALTFFETHKDRLLGAIGGTDAHFRTIGRGLTAYRGDLLEAIREQRTAVVFRAEREHFHPWDVAGYILGLRRLDHRRSSMWNQPRPKS